MIAGRPSCAGEHLLAGARDAHVDPGRLDGGLIFRHPLAGWRPSDGRPPFTDERPVLVAPDAFKGTFRATQVAAAIGRGLERAGLMPPDLCPVADGGEGTLDALLPGARRRERRGAPVSDPLGDPVAAAFGLVEDGGTAIVETATASGLRSSPGRARRRARIDHRHRRADRRGGRSRRRGPARRRGGSATTDGGAGALEAIDEARRARDARVVVLCDVARRSRTRRRCSGRRRAPTRRGGAPERAPRAHRRSAAARPARRADDRRRGRSLRRAVGASTAPTLRPGARWVLEALDFDARMRAAARRRHRRGPARRADPRGQARGRDRHPRAAVGRAAARDRRRRLRSTPSGSA